MRSGGKSELRSMGQEIQAIERALGIDKEAERAREGPLIPLHAFSQTPMCTPQSVQEGREERWDEQATIRRRIRALYFSIPDVEARRLLIRKTRQLEALHKADARDDEKRAEAAVTAAMDTSGLRGFHLAIEVGLFATAAYLGGWEAGLLVGFIAWQMLRPIPRKVRDTSVAQAERDADLVREVAAEILEQVPTFSELEEHTGADQEMKARHG